MMIMAEILRKICIVIVFVLGFTLARSEKVECQTPNDRPIIGVLAQFGYEDPHQFIVASYVKFVESAGARVVPVFAGHPRSYYEELIKKINGLLLPGGGSPLDNGPYAETADILFDLAIELNDNGTHFPVWATCLSFEKLILYFLNGTANEEWKTMCHVENLSLNLEFEPDVEANPKDTQLFREADELMPKIIEVLKTNNVTANYHRVCVLVGFFKGQEKLADLRLISHNTVGNYTFVSMVEHKKYPIFGSMWHPEKNQFEFVNGAHVGNINHDRYAIMVGQYFANFLVDESRKNCQRFENKLKESQHLIYNYAENVVYTGKDPKSSYEQKYIFPEQVNYNSAEIKGSFLLACFIPMFLIIQHLLSH